jgi:phosphatidylglycerol---prolipoprotein diacylglyceryl transferase
MFVNTLSPYILKIGFFELRWYSLVYLLGFFLCWYVLRKHHTRLGVSKDDVEQFIFWSLFAMIIGARLFEVVVWNPGYYWNNPQYILAVWRGGLSFHGGFVGILLAGWYWCKKHSLKFAEVSDIVIVPATLMLALGRVGNFFNHELYGPVTNVAWCVQFNGVEGCRHPAQLYGAIGRLFAFFILLWVQQYRKYAHGFISWLFVFLIGIGRFGIDFVREDIRYLGLSTGQYLSLVMVIVALIALLGWYRRDLKNLFK